MEIGDFFDFGSKMVSSTVHAFPLGFVDKETSSTVIKLILGDYEGIKFPIVFLREYGHKLADILGTGYPSLYLISDKLKTLLEENQISGWKIFPIKLFDKKNNEISGYHGFSVTGRCGPIEDEKAEIINKRISPTGPIYKAYKGLYVGLNRWDKTDFFFPEGTTWTIITKKTAAILKKNKTTNLSLRNLANIEHDVL